MRANIFQHAEFENPAAILNWLATKGFEISYTKFYAGDAFPSIQNVDWLIIMGGPMSVNDETQYPWLVEEKKFIKQCIDSGKKVIGICLGAQLIANVSGSKIYKGEHKEIGWFPIKQVSAPGNTNPIPNNIHVFHWHGETFNLPKGARLLASTKACVNQIFTIGNTVLGMQCHLEMTTEAIEGMLLHCSHEIHPETYIQSMEEIREETKKYSLGANLVLHSLLDSLQKATV